ncbi:hypothetical protein IJ732_04580, partial [bacterium]|nr:hypothetical protein [bacterium]
GLIAQGESEYCGTIDGGLDCGKYILTYHKLFDGLINNCTAYENGQCSQCQNGYQNNGNSCKDIRENTCDTYSGTTCTKCTTENLLVDNECVSKTSLHCQTSNGVSCTECEDGNYLKSGSCKSQPTYCLSVGTNGETCTLKDGSTGYSIGDSFVAKVDTVTSATIEESYSMQHGWNSDYWTGAKNACAAKGLRLPTREEYAQLYAKRDEYPDAIPSSGIYWSSDAFNWEGSYFFDFAEGPTGRNTHDEGSNENATANWASDLGAFCIE